MVKLKLIIATLMLTVLWLSSFAQAEADTALYRIQTVQGNDFIGTIVSEDEIVIVLLTNDFGEIRIKKADVRSKTRIEKQTIKGGEFWPDNLQSSRFFWAPNGYGLKQGEGYYQNIWVLYNQVSFGFTNHFSVSGGMIPIFLLGADITPVWIVPKFSLPVVKGKFNIAGGAFLGMLLGESEGGFGIVFGSATYGGKDNNVNLGVGWGYADGEWAHRPIFNLNLTARLGPRSYLISENYVLNSNDFAAVILSLGGRRMIRNVGLDFAFVIPLGKEVGSFVAIPFLGLSIPFGNYRVEGR